MQDRGITEEELNQFHREYCPYELRITRTYDPWDSCAEIKISLDGLAKLIRDARHPAIECKEMRDIHSVMALRVDLSKVSVSQVKEVFESVQRELPLTPVIMLPSDYDLEAMSTRELQAMRERLNELIEASDFDTFSGIARISLSKS